MNKIDIKMLHFGANIDWAESHSYTLELARKEANHAPLWGAVNATSRDPENQNIL